MTLTAPWKGEKGVRRVDQEMGKRDRSALSICATPTHIWKTGLLQDRAKTESGQRSELGRFEDDGVSGGKSGSELIDG
jgi:hypothetical protein